MNRLYFREAFFRRFNKINDKRVQEEIKKKINQLKARSPIGKKLSGQPYWSLRVNKYRVIYCLKDDGVEIITILSRKKDYREL
ncbi:MAG: type II toxin-antitoxin system RelE family toxin [Nanoarchaeota archaeon]